MKTNMGRKELCVMPLRHEPAGVFGDGVLSRAEDEVEEIRSR